MTDRPLWDAGAGGLDQQVRASATHNGGLRRHPGGAPQDPDMAQLEDLIRDIADPRLRAQIASEVGRPIRAA